MNFEQEAQFEERRRRLMETVVAAVGQVWRDREWVNRDAFIVPAVAAVEGACAALGELVIAANLQRARSACLDPFLEGPSDFVLPDLAELIGQPLEEAYDGPFGTLGFELAKGSDFPSADDTARAEAERLVATHLTVFQARTTNAWIEAYNGSA